MGTWTHTIENDAPTGSGLQKSLKIFCTTADATPAAGDAHSFRQYLEGQNVQSIRKGTSSAQELTLSFWVKSNVTGTYVSTLLDNNNNRQVGAQYTIAAANTWEKKTITFPADSSGVLDNNNGPSLQVFWWLGAGSDRTSGTLQTSWASATTADFAVGQTNLAAATDNYWQVTGVQLEAGPIATPFQFEDFGTTLAKCQRYYYRYVADNGFSVFGLSTARGSDQSEFTAVAPVPMRVPPTSVEWSTMACSLFAGGSRVAASDIVINAGSNSRTNPNATITTVSNLGAAGAAMQVIANDSTSAFIAFSAEL
jgi:hypothetical protein